MAKINDMARDMRREYFRKWRAANPDKVKRHNAAYWRKKAERKLKEDKPADTAERTVHTD